jgi:hypothetical protein
MARRVHRDGLVFQAISWVAARQLAPGDALMRAPHVRPADKGIDGVLIERPCAARPVWRLVVSEDKATDYPRDTVRDEVWPEIVAFERGDRDREITSEASALAGALSDPAEVDALLGHVLWSEHRQYRVSVAVGAEHEPNAGADQLFKGFETHAPGDDCSRRRGEVLLVGGALRPWMDCFCAQVADALRAFDIRPDPNPRPSTSSRGADVTSGARSNATPSESAAGRVEASSV